MNRIKLGAVIPDYKAFKRYIVITVVALILLLIAFSVWKSATEYRLTVSAADKQLRGYSRALREHAERAIGEADGLLLDTIDHIKTHGGFNKVNSRQLHQLLNNHPHNMPQVGAIILINRDGLLVAHSVETISLQTSLADRDYFIHHHDHPEDKTAYISRPFKSRVNNKWRFTLSRPVYSSSGKFDGIAAVAFDIEYFSSFYSSLNIGKKGRILLVRRDGHLMLTEPFRESNFSTDFRKSALIRTYLPSKPNGTFRVARGDSLLESDSRLVSYESLSNYPLVALTNMSMDEALESWRSATILQGTLTLVACSGLFLLMILLLRKIKRIETAYRLQAEQQKEIVAAEERYRLLVDNLPVVTWQSDEFWTTTFISANIEKFYGYTAEEIYADTDTHWSSRIHDEERDAVVAMYKSLFHGTGIYDVEYRIRHKNGQWIWINDFAYSTVLQNGVLVAHGVFSDITARKQAEDERDQLEMQLSQAKKMEAIGHLAGGIAHDFNNLLTPIMGYAEMAAAAIPNNDPLAPKLAGIIAASHKAKTLTQQLLSFGRRQSAPAEIVDLNEIILSFNTILRRTIRESIRIDLALDPEGSFIKGDLSQIEQIILNMTVNAQDAFEGSHGRIYIETCHILMDGENARLHPGMVPGEYVLLSFRDNGCGMSAEVISHIYEPFFTTKQVGHGTGLGLATVYGIVKQHDAYISVTSRQGEGTTFNIYFPGGAKAPAMKTKTALPPVKTVSGDITILLVEDNEMVRDMVQEMLKGFGFGVISTTDPHHAIELFACGAVRIDLLVSDIVMPGMNGTQLYEQLTEQCPSLKVVFISGYPISPSLRGGTLDDEVNYLQKPFTAEALLERINMVL
ncbi:MAG: ATP-binding protein [Desulfuromonadaceae bacterium]|nr:ATP-binding protein [Desulfuromonadaceae bacterium]MDD4131655.1 ATP-binding protein [Desulfuromonadaceae bacterium]